MCVKPKEQRKLTKNEKFMMLTTLNKYRTFPKVFAAHLLFNKNKCCGPLRKYAAMLVLLAAAHVYALADTAATVWQ